MSGIIALVLRSGNDLGTLTSGPGYQVDYSARSGRINLPPGNTHRLFDLICQFVLRSRRSIGQESRLLLMFEDVQKQKSRSLQYTTLADGLHGRTNR